MSVLFFGLIGTQGVLPLHYTDMLIARKGQKDHALADFLDLFHHRLLSLFYRAWAKHRPAIIYENAVRAKQSPDAFTHYILDFIGLGTDAIRSQMQIRDESLLPYAGLIAQRPHSASAIRAILRDFFSVPVEIDQCLGAWYDLSETDRSYLSPELERSQLGVGAFLGDKVWNQQDRFRIRIGPVPLPGVSARRQNPPKAHRTHALPRRPSPRLRCPSDSRKRASTGMPPAAKRRQSPPPRLDVLAQNQNHPIPNAPRRRHLLQICPRGNGGAPMILLAPIVPLDVAENPAHDDGIGWSH